MRAAEDKNCTHFEFPKENGAGKVSRNRSVISRSRPKTTPSKWDDAQKWLVGLSSGGNHSHSKTKPRNSNADDRRLLSCASQRERFSCSSADGLTVEDVGFTLTLQDESETKKIDCSELFWRVNKPMEDSSLSVRPVCVRDMGTEITPVASQDSSRTATPLRASTPVIRSPVSSGSSTPGRCCQGSEPFENCQSTVRIQETKSEVVNFERKNGNGWSARGHVELDADRNLENTDSEQARNPSSLVSQAVAWDEAERAKYMARYKREEVKIQAWENHEKRKAETKMRRKEAKAERMKARAQEKMEKKLAAAQRVAEEKRASAEARLNEQAARTSERAEYIRRTGHLPSSFSFKLPSLCG